MRDIWLTRPRTKVTYHDCACQGCVRHAELKANTREEYAADRGPDEVTAKQIAQILNYENEN